MNAAQGRPTGQQPAVDVRELSRATDATLVASRALVAIAARSMAELEDVTLAQYRALVVLASVGPQTAGELAAALRVHPSTLTRMVDRLVKKGLVDRVADQDDRRTVRVTLAREGRDLLDEVMASRRRELAVVLRRIPADQHRMLIDVFEQFAEAAGELAEGAGLLVDAAVVPADPATPADR
jgi:DNA-binding MarR family transcriptional regulator